MFRQLGVAEVAREPSVATAKPDRDHIGRAVVMRATRLAIHVSTENADAMNIHFHKKNQRALSDGQSKTRTDATNQHPIMKMKPLLNEPVR